MGKDNTSVGPSLSIYRRLYSVMVGSSTRLQAELGFGMYAHAAQREAGKPGELGDVEIDTRLVEHLDAHKW